MKQFFKILLALSLACSMTACGNKPAPEETTKQEASAEGTVLSDSLTSLDPQADYPAEYPESTALPPTSMMATSVKKKTVLSKLDGKTAPDKQDSDSKEELRAVWLSYLDLQAILTGKSQAQFTENIAAAFDRIEELGLNTVIAQVRPFGDALYASALFPWSYVATGTEGKDPGFDPLAIMVREAHVRDLDIEAWINPYRVRIPGKKEAICKENPVHQLLRSGDAIAFEGGTYYNPASKKAQKLITDGVTEIIENYDVDGVHFDDYFYPTTRAAFDQSDYASYKKDGGTLPLNKWRMENVNQLVRAVYTAIQAQDDDILFGISPQGNLKNNYETQFIDVGLWLSQPGYVDYICPQIYFGFQNETCPYSETVKAWDSLIKTDAVKLYVGLAPYKIGSTDNWAGGGKYEWANSTSMMSEMVQTARQAENYGGFILFRYDSVFLPASDVKKQVKNEISNLKELLD